MARVPYLSRSDLPPEHAHLVEGDMNLRRAMANTIGGAHALGAVVRWLRTDTRLDRRLCELAILQVAFLTGATYEWVQHVDLARRCGVSDADILAIAEETAERDSNLDALAKTVLRGAREITSGIAMSEKTFGELREALGTEPLMELVIAISFYNGMARVLETLEIDVEPRLAPLLGRFPLPRRESGKEKE